MMRYHRLTQKITLTKLFLSTPYLAAFIEFSRSGEITLSYESLELDIVELRLAAPPIEPNVLWPAGEKTSAVSRMGEKICWKDKILLGHQLL